MEKLGRYEIREIVGEGAMARVYKAYDPEIDRTIAVKLLKAQLADDDQYRLRFLREARAAGVLSHPNIVTIFDVGVDGKKPYIAMELIDGMTLSELLGTDKVLSVKEIVEIGIQLSRALDYAHKKGIIHRDIKPGNIMLINETSTVKVADFGICRIDDPEGGEQTSVAPGQLSETVGGVKVTTAPALEVAGTERFFGQPVRVGGGFNAVTAVVAELLLVLGSCVEELTVTELLITAPFDVGQFTFATNVMVAEAPAGSELKVTVRLLADPPHMPLPVKVHETKVTAAGRLSVTTKDAALTVERLVTVMTKVRFAPATTGLGEAVWLIATSASSAGTLPTAKRVALLIA